MNFKHFFALALLCVGSTSVIQSATGTVTIKQSVYVDIEKVIKDAKSLDALRSNLEKRAKSESQDLEDLNKKMEEKAQKLQADSLKDDAKKKLQEELQALGQKRMGMMNGLQVKMQKLQEDFIETVKAKIAKVGNKHGWGLVHFPGVTMLVDSSLDKTQFLITELNKEYEAERKAKKS